MRWPLFLLAPVLAVAAAAQTRPTPRAEVRAAWVTTARSDALASPAATAATMQAHRAIGLNTVYVECWKRGATHYPSAAYARLMGKDRNPELLPGGALHGGAGGARDLLGEVVLEAHRAGLLVLAWFEYGLMAAHQSMPNAFLERVRPWLMTDRNGSIWARNGFAWLNPLRPEVQEFVLGIVLDAVRGYDLDGVQFDDRLAWPHVEMGYDAYTREAYAREHGGRPPPAEYRDPDWLRWRAGKVAAFAAKLAETLRAERPGLLLSLSPGPHPWSYQNYAVDWPEWSRWPGPRGGPRAGFDEFVPQCYRASHEGFAAVFTQQRTRMAHRPLALVAGISLVSDDVVLPWDDLRRSLELVRASGAAGHAFWHSKAVTGEHAADLRAFYRTDESGPARHPLRPADWRPPPREVSPLHQDRTRWSLDGVPAGAWRVVYERDGVRREVQDLALTRSGRRDPLVVPAGQGPPDRVFLLLDRRPDMARPVGATR
ncbi:MAG: family 10 glycosylhydrolase [Planctomycetes bacterium]|nr:family 10 glycosylhydrolase [Planctomycetota bacterium]